MMGKKRMQKAEPPQLIIVEYGKKFAGTISGMYIQTTGPRESPKLIMQRNRPIKIKVTDRAGVPLAEKPKAMMKFVMTAPIVPNCKIIFLPYLPNRKELITAVATCSKFMIDGRMALKDWRLPEAISPAYVETALMPTNCCKSER